MTNIGISEHPTTGETNHKNERMHLTDRRESRVALANQRHRRVQLNLRGGSVRIGKTREILQPARMHTAEGNTNEKPKPKRWLKRNTAINSAHRWMQTDARGNEMRMTCGHFKQRTRADCVARNRNDAPHTRALGAQ
jgi:hypothetical protein